MNKAFSNFVWENFPSTETPINDANLMKVNNGLDEVDNRVISLNSSKFNKSEAQLLIKNIAFDLQTGILTKYYYNGSTEEINTGLSKVDMNLRFDTENQMLYIVNADGSEDPVDLSVFITNYEFEDSDTIANNASGGKVKPIVKEGSIQEKHLNPNYLGNIKVEVAKAQASQTAAATSEANAKASENAAKASENAAKESEENASSYASSASESAATATQKASAAAESEVNAEECAISAEQSADNASGFAAAAESYKTSALSSASLATTKANESSNYATKSQSYAVGTGGEFRENDDSDCAEYYYNQVKNISQGLGGIIPMGTITFDGLSDPNNQKAGYMFNISDSFMSDDRFQDGGGIFYGAGNNVLYTADGKWDVLAAAMVSGVKGNAETEYRQGFVNLTAENVGAASTFHASSSTTYGESSDQNYGHAKASSTVPKPNGTASVGSETDTFARGDHVHPLQTSVSGSSGSCTGNAATATKATNDGNGNNIVNTYERKATEIIAILPSNETSISFTNAAITVNSTFDIYTNQFGFAPTGMFISENTLTLTFNPQIGAIIVIVVVRKIIDKQAAVPDGFFFHV